jgi:hypothetical protein
MPVVAFATPAIVSVTTVGASTAVDIISPISRAVWAK